MLVAEHFISLSLSFFTYNMEALACPASFTRLCERGAERAGFGTKSVMETPWQKV